MDHYSAELAAYAADFRLAAAPPEVVRMAKRVVLDQLGCQVACSTLPWSLQFRAGVRATGTCGEATVVVHGDRVSVDDATFVNSAFGHGNEIDDASVRTPSHGGSTVVPAVLAVAERLHAPGARVLEATIAGYETLMRVSYATGTHLRHRGHHSPTALGPFGAAAAVAHLLGLDAAATLNALGIAGSHSAGLAQYTRGGGSVKRIHCAIAAMSGVRAAYLAANGVTGPSDVLEGARGFCAAFAGTTADVAQLTRALGTEYAILDTGFKRYSCAFITHTALEALDAIRASAAFEPSDVVAVTVGASADNVQHFYAGDTPPPDLLSAQFSIGYCLALRVLRGGNGFWDWHEEDLRAPDVLAFAALVTTEVDPLAESERRDNMGTVVRVTTRDGRTLEARQRYSKGLPQNPMSDAEFVAKFTGLVVPQLGAAAAERIVDGVERLDRLDDTAALMPLLVRQDARA